jgi:hypothetical protein
MMTPKLYYQLEDKIPLDNFCSDAAIGARENGILAVGTHTPPAFHPYNIVVGSVEFTQEYLDRVIPPIDRSWSIPYEKREIVECTIDEIKGYPCFIKPSQEIKAWTGIVVENEDQARLFTQDYQKKVFCSAVKDIESEYRVYVVKNRGIIGVKHYLGDPYMSLDKDFVEECYRVSRVLNENSYTLDFGITKQGETFLIEVNDGWAIGNYGLNPSEYYSFVKNRFLQLSGVLK